MLLEIYTLSTIVTKLGQHTLQKRMKKDIQRICFLLNHSKSRQNIGSLVISSDASSLVILW